MAIDSTYTFRHAFEEWLTYSTTKDGRQSDDNSWSARSLVNKLLDHRAMLIESVKKRKGVLSDAMRQELSCVEMRRVPRVECPCAPPDGCYWAKSVYPIPVPLLISYVSDVRGQGKFIRTNWEDVHRLKYSRIKTKRNRRHYLLREDGEGKNYLYVILPEAKEKQALDVPAFTLAGIFMNPIDIAQYPGCGEDQPDAICNPLDVPFCTDRTLRVQIFSNLSAEILSARGQAPPDVFNNDAVDQNVAMTKV